MSKKQEFINVALSQVGYKEQKIDGKGNYTKYGKWYGINPGAWCDMFVCWCANEVGVLKTLIPKYANVGDTKVWYRERGLLTETPHIGDLFIVVKKKKDSKGKYYASGQHIGIIEYIDGKYIHTIEGNASDKVKQNKRKIGYKNFSGILYCNVQWETEGYTGKYPTLPSRGYFKQGDKGSNVKDLQKFLNWALDIKLQLDGSYGPLTKDSVVRLEKLLGNKANGLYGQNDLAKSKQYKK